jgi:hypothetical protein
MCKRFGWSFAAMLALGVAGLPAAGADAATIASGALLDRGITLDLDGATACGASGGMSTNVGSFSAIGPAGSGQASCGDRTTSQVKTPTTPFPYGRYALDGEAWVDSNDLKRVVWRVDVDKPVRAVSFLLTDAHDQPDSYFRLKVDEAVWRIADREENGAQHLISILFDEPTTDAKIRFQTSHNDGWGISAVTVQPVPAPPALLLAASGFGLIALVRARRRTPRA